MQTIRYGSVRCQLSAKRLANLGHEPFRFALYSSRFGSYIVIRNAKRG